MFDSFDLGAFSNGLGVVGICVFLAVCLIRGWVITGREASQIREDRNHWRNIAEEYRNQVSAMLAEEQTSTTVMKEIQSYVNRNRGE
jgi:hypothetical protein